MLNPEFNPYLDDYDFGDLNGLPSASGPQGAPGVQGPAGAQGPSGSNATAISGALSIRMLSDVTTEPGTIYFSIERGRLVFKDFQGKITNLTT